MYIYILGRPHSGSTILDILLGNLPAVAGLGQLVSDMGKLDKPCSCGHSIGDCPFWTRVRAEVEAAGITWAEAVAASVRQAHIRRFWWTWRAAADDPEIQRLIAITRAIARAVASVSGKPHLVDSSKEPTRALFLARFLPEARLIQLVRDPRASVASHYWRWRERQVYHFLRRDWRLPGMGPLFMLLAAASWTIGNLLGELAIAAAGPRALRLRYEDLRDRPHETLARLGQFLGLSPEALGSRLAEGATLAAYHQIGGNRIRLERALRFDPAIERRRPALPTWLKVATLLLCWPLMGRYGYGRRLRTAGLPESGALSALRMGSDPE